MATPSSSWSPVTRSAAARTSAGAWPMATPKPALRIIGTSFTSSPTAQISAGSTSQRFARCRTAVQAIEDQLLECQHLVSRADRAEMEQGVARRDFAPATVLCRPARIDLGVLAVLAHIVIKKRPAGGETWH